MSKTAEIQDAVDNLRRFYHAINAYSRKAERETALTGPQLWAVQLLAEGASMRVSELAGRMYLRPATVVGIVDRLEAKGLVTRTRSRHDRRAVDLALTEEGERVARSAPEVAQVVLLKGLDTLTDEQFAVVAEGMQHMVRLLDVQHLVPQPLQ